MNYVLDASIVIKYYVPEIYTDKVIALLEDEHDFHVPELILTEISNIVWKKVRYRNLPSAEGKKIIAAILIKDWNIYSHKQTLVSAYVGAEATGQTVYDFTYLALAVSLSYELVTADEKFYKALEKTPFKSNLIWIGDIP